MITVRFEAYRNKKVFTGIDETTLEPTLLNKLELEYKTEEYFEDDTDPELLLNAFKETCVKQRFEQMLFDCDRIMHFDGLTETEDGFVYETHSENYSYCTRLIGWKDWTSNVNRTYQVKEVIFNDTDSTTTTIERNFKDDESRMKVLVGHLCPDFEWELDETNIGFPITYCTQKGVTVSYDYHGLY